MSEGLPIPPALLETEPPGPVLEVLRTLAAAGHRSWIVGGAVRDLLLGRLRPGADLDVATPARPEQVFPLFRKVVATGVEHGTVTVVLRGQAIEVTTFRGEGAYLDGRRPSTVTFLDDIEADLARRDFTVNALAWDPIAPAFRDPFDGQADLRRRVLRAVGDPLARFAEDGLRPVRAARFAAQLGFALDPATAAAIPGALPVTARVSAERLSAELSRLLLAPHAREGLALLEESGLLALLLPELAALAPQARAHAFDVAATLEPELSTRLAGLLHGVAGGLSSEAAASQVRARLVALRVAGRTVERAAALVAHQGCLLDAGRAPPPVTPADVRRWLARVGRELAPSALALGRACAQAGMPEAEPRRRELEATVVDVERTSPPLSAGELALGGREVMALLGIPAGPQVGEALQHLLERTLDEPALNTRAVLTSELRAWWAAREGGGPVG